MVSLLRLRRYHWYIVTEIVPAFASARVMTLNDSTMYKVVVITRHGGR